MEIVAQVRAPRVGISTGGAPLDLPGQIRSRVNVRLGRNQGGMSCQVAKTMNIRAILEKELISLLMKVAFAKIGLPMLLRFQV